MQTEVIKKDIKEGARTGVWAFLVSVVYSFVMSLVFNVAFLDKANQVINGSLSDTPDLTLKKIIQVTSFILNISIFNSAGETSNGGEFHMGILIVILIPAVSFWIADRRDNKSFKANIYDAVIFIVSSLTYSLLVVFYSIVTKGTYLGIDYNFVSFRNFIMTFIIVGCIQFIISLNYNRNFNIGLKSTRFVLRIFLGGGGVLAFIGMVILLTVFTKNFFFALGGSIVLLPNVVVYMLFTLMGTDIEFGDQLITWAQLVNVDLENSLIPLPIRIIFLIIFIGVIIYTTSRIPKEKYFLNLGIFAISYSFISVILAYCTRINLGLVKNVLDFQLGINIYAAGIVPIILIGIIGLIIFLIRYLLTVIQTEG